MIPLTHKMIPLTHKMIPLTHVTPLTHKMIPLTHVIHLTFLLFLFICFFNSQEFTFIKKPIHYHLTWMYKDLQHNYYVTIAFF